MIEPAPIKTSEWITIAEAARIADDSESHIRELVQTGKVKTRQRKQIMLVNRNALLAQHQPIEPTSDLFPSQRALALIEQRSELEQTQRNAVAIRLVTEWSNATGEEAAEQAETLSYLIEHLDEAHANRDIFSDEVKYQLRQILDHNE